MILQEVAMLCIANNRTRTYLKHLLEKDLIPAFLLILKNLSSNTTPGQTQEDLLEEWLIKLAQEKNIPYTVVPTTDVNSYQVIAAIKKRPEVYFIYSGPGGTLLRKEILSCNKQFLHVHPGCVPDFKGSTTIYYQALVQGQCGSSAIFLEETIDSGPVLATRTFELPNPNEDWDYDYDPRIRAALLVQVLQDYSRSGHFTSSVSSSSKGKTYFIAHPVLRHIARLYGNKCKPS